LGKQGSSAFLSLPFALPSLALSHASSYAILCIMTPHRCTYSRAFCRPRLETDYWEEQKLVMDSLKMDIDNQIQVAENALRRDKLQRYCPYNAPKKRYLCL
jgi:hypothetical protein